jgi:hypothetical protein
MRWLAIPDAMGLTGRVLCHAAQVLWDVATGEAICGSPTHADFVLCCRFFSNQSDKLITAGNYNLQVRCGMQQQPARPSAQARCRGK